MADGALVMTAAYFHTTVTFRSADPARSAEPAWTAGSNPALPNRRLDWVWHNV
jgi:hypothetical protein